jgi:mannosyltransferase
MSNNEKILVIISFALCISLRLLEITQKNLWFDEVFSWHISLSSFYEIIVRTSNDIHPPLYYFVLKIWMILFGDSVFAIRLLSSIFTSAAVFFIYPVSRRFLSPVNSLIVLLLYIISPLNIYYSQEARMAAMNLFLNAGSIYFFVKLVLDKRFASEEFSFYKVFRSKTAWGYILFSSAALYTHYFSFFILAGQVVYIIAVNRRYLGNLKPFASIYSAIMLLYVPWIPQLIEHISKGQAWRTPQTLFAAAKEYVNFLKDINLGLYYHYTDLDLVRYISIFLAIVIIVSLLKIVRHRQSISEGNNKLLILVIVFVPLILAGIISVRQKVEFYRYLSILVPYISIFIVFGLSLFRHKYITYITLIIIASINIYGITIQNSFNFKNDDYRGIIRSIESRQMEGERIYVEPHYNGWVIDYYRKQENLNLPPNAYIRYGWGEISDSLNAQSPASFWLVLDYSAIDTSRYNDYINSVFVKGYVMDSKETYNLAPTKVELYRFKK